MRDFTASPNGVIGRAEAHTPIEMTKLNRKEEKLSLLSKMVFCSTSYRGRLYEDYSSLPKAVQGELKAVTKAQRHKFKKYGVVPLPVLTALWHLGYLPGKTAPVQGMKVLTLTEYLRSGRFLNQQAAEKGSWLYQQIIKEEVIGRASH